MKEHALFLEAVFTCKDNKWIQKADYFRQQFEKLLIDVIKISDCQFSSQILESDELVTEFTIPAERHTEHLSGILINTDITESSLAETLKYRDFKIAGTKGILKFSFFYIIWKLCICLQNSFST